MSVSRTWERLRPKVFCQRRVLAIRVLAIMVSQYFLSRGKREQKVIRAVPCVPCSLIYFAATVTHLAVEPVNADWQHTRVFHIALRLPRLPPKWHNDPTS